MYMYLYHRSFTFCFKDSFDISSLVFFLNSSSSITQSSLESRFVTTLFAIPLLSLPFSSIILSLLFIIVVSILSLPLSFITSYVIFILSYTFLLFSPILFLFNTFSLSLFLPKIYISSLNLSVILPFSSTIS